MILYAFFFLFPTASTVLTPSLKTEGMLWFSDLTLVDSTLILPILLGVTNLLIIEVRY